MSERALVVRLDGMGDMLVCGPAIRAVAAAGGPAAVLAGPHGAAVARLLPGVETVLTWNCPWIAADPPSVDSGDLVGVVGQIAALQAGTALILTSFHQSALPTALLLRMAGVQRIAAISDDYPGALLDVRVPSPPDAPEPVRMLAVARAAGFELPAGDDGRLALREPLTAPIALPARPYVAVHPGTSAPARAYPQQRWCEVVATLTARGWPVLVTGGAGEAELTAQVAGAGQLPGQVRDLGGQLDVMGLAALLQRATVAVVANTGPAHLAAAVGTPVVSLFAPTVPAVRWAPYGADTVVLGEQSAPCRDTRARTCPVPGHPCLSSVTAEQVVAAVDQLASRRIGVPA